MMEKCIHALLAISLLTLFSTCYAEDVEKEGKPSKTETKEETKEDASPLTGTLDITSNYLFRGISQTNNTPAFQGGLTYAFKTGIHFDLWGSNVYMPVPDTTNIATVEVDLSAGIANSINDNNRYDIYIARYFYPKATAFQYNELIASYTFYLITGLFGYSNNVFNSSASGTYYNIAVNLPIPSRFIYFDDVSVNGAVGYYSLPQAVGSSYKDYSFILKKEIKNYSLSAQWTNTDHRLLNNSLDHSQVIGTVSVSF